MKCHYCNSTTKELRPYGPNHLMVCFGCAMATPERKAEAGKNFEIHLMGCGDGVVVIGEDTGPRPLDCKPQ